MDQLVSQNSFDEREENVLEFTYIFETYYKRVYNYIYYRINSNTEAEDLTSQVFEKVMLKIGTYSKTKSPFEVWLFAIARNVINDYFRGLKKYRFLSIDKIEDLIATANNPEEITLKAETNDKLLKSLKILSTKERNIIALKFGGNLKNKEIAEILRFSESNIGVLIYRIIKKLKAAIEGEI